MALSYVNSTIPSMYLSRWPRMSAFKRPKPREDRSRASRSFMIDDILRREEPANKRKQIRQIPLYSGFGNHNWGSFTPPVSYHEDLNASTTEASQCNPAAVICPVPKYFRAFLNESRRFRRTRTVFTREQLKLMEDRFVHEKYLSTHGRNDFARRLKLTPLQVKTWFQNRRMKWKKEMLKKDPNAVTTRAKGRPKKDEYR